MRVVITPEAQSDLRRIALWIANDNPPRAISFVEELSQAAKALAGLPQGYPLIPGTNDRESAAGRIAVMPSSMPFASTA